MRLNRMPTCVSRPFILAVILILALMLLPADACFNCKNERDPREEPLHDRETGKIFFRTFNPEQKLDWAHHQTVGERKAGRRGVEPTDHNYNTMMLAVSKGLDKPYRALYRSRSGNQEIWDKNKGTQHVQQLTQKLRKEDTIIGRIKKLLPHKPHNYQRIIKGSSGSNHPTSTPSFKESKSDSGTPNELKQHLKGSQSPRSREKVKSWLAGIPDDLYSSKDSTSHQKHERVPGHSNGSSSRGSVSSTHDRLRSSSSPLRAYSRVSSSIDSLANIHVTNPGAKGKMQHSSN
ncbi:uncharacterized protein FA14DRAFT_172832 [Meira miltonrushii]|uniref:Uncharacterized protein n=1 Tax=Meira miltonrushii TaxID=1280837 RepID=A0A316VGW6_9BASI|nr:uncharacterized protein FA14DRAFT_172832 [Meira miltonrushii]PWN36278.1 hypothetical protein FA14DRAFT_172832 [Meira miltonrushii]